MKRILYIFLGSISLIFGLIGIILPVLPTTPFLLLTSFFYMRSSDKLYQWLLHHRLFGAIIYSYTSKRAIDRSVRNRALIFLWLMLMISILILRKPLIAVGLILIGSAVTLHLMKLRLLSEDESYRVRQELLNMKKTAATI